MGDRAATPAAEWPATTTFLRARRSRALALLGLGAAATAAGAVALVLALRAGLDEPVGPSGVVLLVAAVVALPALGFGGVEAGRLRRLQRGLGQAPWTPATASVAVAHGGSVRQEAVVLVGLAVEGRGTVELRVAGGPTRSQVVLRTDPPAPPLWLADGSDPALAVVSPAGGGDPVVVRAIGSVERAVAGEVDLVPPAAGAHAVRIRR